MDRVGNNGQESTAAIGKSFKGACVLCSADIIPPFPRPPLPPPAVDVPT